MGTAAISRDVGVAAAYPASTARAILLVQALEEQDPQGHIVDLEARRNATLKALATKSDDWLGRRALELVERLRRDRPGWLRAAAGVEWTGRRVLGALAFAFAFGVAGNALGPSHLINILAPPLLGLMAWNGAMYLVLLGRFFFAAPAAPPSLDDAPPKSAWWSRLLPAGPSLQAEPEAPEARIPVLAAARWTSVARHLHAARLQCLLHVASIVAVLGLVLGMYARGLIFEYRATWESTFLSAATVDSWVGTLTAPARALTGIDLPDAASVAAPSSGPAAPWIHLWAVTALLFVGLPRGLAALFQLWRARHLARRLPLSLPAIYVQRLRASAETRREQVQVLLYSYRPTEKTLDRLRRALLDLVGARAAMQVLPPLDYGADLPPAAGAGLRVVVFSATHTPELEVHGEWLAALKQDVADGARLLLVVDESPFLQRLGDESGSRLESRRKAWRRTFEHAELPAAFVELGQGGDSGGDRILAALTDNLWPGAMP